MTGGERHHRSAIGSRWLLAVAALFPAAIAAADGVPKSALTLPLVQRCLGACDAILVPLDNGNAMAAWSGDGLAVWAQAIDVRGARLLGAPIELRDVNATLVEPLGVGLADGDFALFGVLANGRITFTRGSEHAARRVAPKVIVGPSTLEVQDVAATRSGDGIALLILREPHMEDLTAPREPIELELHWLNGQGEALRPPMRWKSGFGLEPRIAACDGRLYVAWQSNPGVVVTSISPGFERAPERTVRTGRGFAWNLGPLVCSGGDARLFSAWRNSAMTVELAPVFKILELPGEAPKGAKPGSWQSVKLSAPPHVKHRALDVYPRESGVQVVVQNSAATKLVTLAATDDTRVIQQLDLPRNPNCLPSANGAQAVCVERKTLNAEDPACPKYVTTIKLSFYGQPATSPATNAKTYDYWANGPIRDANAPPPWTAELEKALVRCTSPEFQGLRDALTAWCTNPATKPSVEVGYRAYCDRQVPESLLSQAITCSVTGTQCGRVPLASVPAVDREAFEHGERVPFSHLNCSVWFSRDAKGWRVVDRECVGD